MRKKKFAAMALAGTLSIGNVFPAFALDLRKYYRIDSTEIKTDYGRPIVIKPSWKLHDD